ALSSKRAVMLLGPERDSSADSGSLNLCISVVKTSGFNTIPEYIQKNTLNDVTIFHYDSDMDSKMPCPDWINSTAARREWNYMQFQTDRISYHITQGFESAVQQFNRTGTANIYQARGCCVLYPNGTSASSLTHTFNGKDFIGFDFDRKTFVAPVHEAVVYKHQRETRSSLFNVLHFFGTQKHIEGEDIYTQYNVMKTLRKILVSVTLYQAGSVTVTCHVTGFYPREVQVFWLGSDLQPVDEGVTEILPNGDGTYQTRKSVIVPEEDVGKQNYSCVVLHISIPNNITTVWGTIKYSTLNITRVIILYSLLQPTPCASQNAQKACINYFN
uniref:Ig-like domain-containing protein n=1 Tax=Astyanax mexicanus TaxID=7994 RepID=A0A8B9K1F0_ASTMX